MAEIRLHETTTKNALSLMIAEHAQRLVRCIEQFFPALYEMYKEYQAKRFDAELRRIESLPLEQRQRALAQSMGEKSKHMLQDVWPH